MVLDGFTMNKNMIIAIVAVAAIAVVGVSAFVFLGGNHSSSEDYAATYTSDISTDSSKTYAAVDTPMRVFGNVNGDMYLNEADVTALKALIDAGTWNSSTQPLADTNLDGVLDQKDVDRLNKFIKGEKTTMAYLDWNNKAATAPYPLTDYLGSNYGIYTEFSTGLDMGIILGIYNKFTYMANGDIGPSDLDTAMYPDAGNIKQVSIKTPGLEALYSGKVRVMMGDPKFLGGYVADAESLGFTVIKLPENRFINDIGCGDTLVTMGALCNAQDKTKAYIDFCDKVEAKILAANAAVSTPLSYVIPYTAPGYLPEIYVDGRGTGTMVTSDVETVDMLPVTSKMSTTAIDGFDKVDAESIVALDPDTFIVSMFGYSSSKSYTVDQIKKVFTDFVELGFDASTAGTNDRVFAMPFENCSLAGIACVLVLGSMLYPSEINADEAWALMNEYYHTFTNFDDSKDVKDSKFAPLSYAALKS
ncbi:transmembrane protein [methanogenic archaeon ISO4-H5]|nr:transmembrane protein [methanogenic archaeon ISO4-H5]